MELAGAGNGRHVSMLEGNQMTIQRLAGEIELPGMEGSDQAAAEALAIAQAEELSEIMRTAKADISGRAGELERNSPLSYGTGENPTLF
jgi:hypothetical protein